MTIIAVHLLIPVFTFFRFICNVLNNRILTNVYALINFNFLI